MPREEIVNQLRQRPFRPFRLHLTNGLVHEVRHPEMALPTAHDVVIGIPATDAPAPAAETYVIVSLLHIVQLEQLPVPVSPASN